MNEWLVVAGVVATAVSGLPGLFFDRRSGAGERLAAGLVVAGAAAGVVGAARALIAPDTASPIRHAWSVPSGSLHVEVDALSAMFEIQVFVLAALGAIYGLRYWSQADHPDDGRKLRACYGLTVGGMALVGVARNVVLFMAGWEVMAIGAFLSITTEDRQARVREVGYLYLIATRIGTLCVIAAFVLLMVALGNPEIEGTLDGDAPLSTAIFVLALVGCGLKAGVMPLHVWLPGAHSTAPSHVSALMSGALIKMGVYGLLRFTSLVPSPPMWWGGVVLAAGVVSGVLGVAFAIGQHDLKRLLAYHSVENIGIICMGIGLAELGRASGRNDLVALGMAGALLHVWNHGLFKALLFLCAGGVVHATGTRELDHLGGLARRMRWTTLGFVVGAVAICGLPPLNGFVSELLVYLGLLHTTTGTGGAFWLVGAMSATLLALIGALAVACFVKVVGVVFLGEPRSPEAAAAHEVPAAMLGPALVLAILCAVIGIGAPLVAPVLDGGVAAWAPELAAKLPATNDLAPFDRLALVYLPLIALAALAGWWLLRKVARAPAPVGTWDCGYAAPTARMQYTSSSFAEMLVGTFAWALRPEFRRPKLDGPFPAPSQFHSEVRDTVLDRLLVPVTRSVDEQRRWVTWMQHGSSHAYILYILATLVALLLWKGG